MKTCYLSLLLSCSLVSSNAARLVEENFDDTTLEEFAIIAPGNVSISNGLLKSTNRGKLVTKDEFEGRKTIEIRFKPLDGQDFTFYFATDGETVGSYDRLIGSWVNINSREMIVGSDGPNGEWHRTEHGRRTGNGYTLKAGEWHDLTIDDQGDKILVTFDDYTLDVDFLKTSRHGLKIGFNSKEYGRGVEVDSIKIYSAPEYEIIESNFTWQEAKADAEARGGRLAVLDTQEKIDAANTYLEELGEWPVMWIGLTDESEEGFWKWINNTPLTAQNWENREPNNSFGGAPEHYAVISNSSRSRDKKWNDLPPGAGLDFAGNPTGAYLLEIIDENRPTPPAVPFVAIDPLYESPTGESITLDATPTIGFPTEFTYQWCFNGFKIPANLGGTASSINIDNLQANEGTWSVSITNSEGIFEQEFEYRVYVDSDSDGLSDAFEELISETDIDKEDTDDDGLSDAEEFNTYRTNPNSPDSDSDGFNDLYELETAYDPNSAESVPDALVNIITAIEVKFNAAIGATYAIEFSTDNQNWDVIEDDIVGEGGAVERLYSKQNFPTGFFRVERRDQ